MAASIFMELDDIEGGSRDQGGKVDVINVSWGVSNSGGEVGRTRKKGQAVLGEVIITMDTDLASTELMKRCCTGLAIPKVTIEFFEAGEGTGAGERSAYYRVTLTTAFVTSFSMNKSEGDDISENISFKYEEILFENIEPDKRFEWNALTNVTS